MSKSKPIDLMCPIQDVSLRLFNAYWKRTSETDRYFHMAFSVNHGIVAVWHWERGVWWTCDVMNILVRITGPQIERLHQMGLLP